MSMEDAVSTFRDLCKFPEPAACAKIGNGYSNGVVLVNSEWSQRDLEKQERIKFKKSYFLSKNESIASVQHRSLPTEINDQLWNVESPSGTLQAVVRKTKNKKGDDRYFIEVWSQDSKMQNVDLEACEKHGKIYEPDNQFGCFEWSASEGHILYIAEKKDDKTMSYFDKKAFKQETDTDKDCGTPGNEHVMKEDWGEQLVGKCNPVLCILDVETGVVTIMETVPSNISVGQAIWGPDDASLYFVGWDTEPWKLGLIYCPIRKSWLYHLDIQSGDCVPITDGSKTVLSPKFNKDMSKLVYLSTAVGGPHCQTSALVMYDQVKKNSNIIVDIVHSPKSSEEFPGIHIFGGLPDRCWSDDNARVIFHSVWRSRNVALVSNTETKDVTRLPFDDRYSCVKVLDVHDDWVLASASAINAPPRLFIGKLPLCGKEADISWTMLDADYTIIESLKDITWSIQQHTPPEDQINPAYKDVSFESILYLPKISANKKVPLVVFPHGGPHSVFVADFTLRTAFFCLLGYAVVEVNYRGSFGFGMDNILSLPNNIGKQDVKDCQAAVLSAIQNDRIDSDSIVIWGGSHGGFLTGHLIGQYPDFYKAAVMRNPVVNLVSMFNVTDIPDWVFVEGGKEFTFKAVNDGKDLDKLFKMSPMCHIDKVKTPTLVMIGEADKRVPPAQGKEYYRALKARNIPTRLLAYPENNHTMGKVEAESDSLMNIYHWFSCHLSAKK